MRWQEDALCSPHPDWSTDKKPSHAVMVWLQGHCVRCPVQMECAQDALDTKTQAGVRAGVYIPIKSTSFARGDNQGWIEARAQLRAKIRRAA